MATNPFMTSENFTELFDPKWNQIFFMTWALLPEQYKSFCTVKKSGKYAEYDHHVADLGQWEEKAPLAGVKYEAINMGMPVTYLHKAYGMGAQVERELVDDAMYDVIGKLPKAMARGAQVTVEIIAADVLNLAFSRLGYDGVPLCSASHPLYGNLGGTASNRLTEELSLTGLKSAISLGRAQVSDAGLKESAFRGQVDLYFPTGLEWKVLEMLDTPTTPWSNENTKNVVAGKVRNRYPLDYLTDATNWFIKDTGAMDDTIVFWWRIPVESKKTQIFDVGTYKWAGYERFGVGHSNWRGWVGSEVAG